MFDIVDLPDSDTLALLAQRYPALEISSSDIRGRVAAGRPIRYLVPGPVERRIRELGLYR